MQICYMLILLQMLFESSSACGISSRLNTNSTKPKRLIQRLISSPTKTDANETQTPISTKLRMLKQRFSQIGQPTAPLVIDVDRMIYNLQSGASHLVYTNDIIILCRECRKIFLRQPILLELTAPIKVLGDIHGQFSDLLRLFKAGHPPPRSEYLFLGDYVDRGQQSLETICLLFAYKLKYPDTVFLLRGIFVSVCYVFMLDCFIRKS